jgi:hypothetical protein
MKVPQMPRMGMCMARDYRDRVSAAARLFRETLTQLHLPELAGGSARDRLDELVAFRQLPFGKAALCEVLVQLCGRGAARV